MDAYVTHDLGSGAEAEIGATESSGGIYSDIGPSYGGFNYELNGNTFPSVATSSAVGLWTIFRTNSSTLTAYRNGYQINSSTSNTGGLPNLSFYIGAMHDPGTPGNYSSDTISMTGFGGGAHHRPGRGKGAVR